MFRIVIEDKNIDCKLNTAIEISNVIYDNTSLWMLACHVKEVCNEMKFGDKWANKDVGVTIECI